MSSAMITSFPFVLLVAGLSQFLERGGVLVFPLVATIIIELLVLIALKERRKKVLLASVVVNILTNVPLNIYVLSEEPDLGRILLAELLVFFIEMLWYGAFVGNLRQAAVYSFLCNAISFLLGLLFELLLLIPF